MWPAAASAQDYPTKPVKWIVPCPAGGPADSMSRVITEKMAVLLGQPIVIETRAGAAGITGVASVAKADPDGYTIGIASSGTLRSTSACGTTCPITR
jgi:tripartite-type tricarboxylate transporter receptor subunit TctC